MTDRVTTWTHELKLAIRSLSRSKGLSATVMLTLALGIGANAAIFTLLRGVLLRPLVNRDEDRLVYIRQTAPGWVSGPVPFSVPEIQDLRAAVRTMSAMGEFSTIDFTVIGLGEPREVRAGVVDGRYFEVMGLRPVLGRLLEARDDGPTATGAAVLTHKFWLRQANGDPNVIGKTITLGSRTATVIGVLEPSVPYPAETEIIANIVTSPHHLSAMMVTGRLHRMTQLFGRLAPGTTLASANEELKTVYANVIKAHPEAYPDKSRFQIDAVMLRDQITTNAKTILLVLLAAAILIFLISCSNVANLILARTVRREGEFALRAALGAGAATLRRTLLAESMVLCVTGSLVGIIIAQPMVTVLARYASRFSVRATDLTVDSSVLWVAGLLAVIAAIVLAFVPRLPGANDSRPYNFAASSLRISSGTHRRLRVFSAVQIAACFVLLAGATMLASTLLKLRSARTGLDTRNVLTVKLPVMSYGRTPEQIQTFYEEVRRRLTQLPGVDAVAVGTFLPWKDYGKFGVGLEVSADGHVNAPGEEAPRARVRVVSPGYFASVGVPIIAGRDFNDWDRKARERVVIVSQSFARRMFPNQDVINRHMMWTGPILKFVEISGEPRRIIGVAADVEDEIIVPGAAMLVYLPFSKEALWGGNLFVHTRGNPYELSTPITRTIREIAADQPVENAATLEDVRAEVLTPERLNTLVFGGFAVVALAIAVVGVAGVLAFSVSGRTREFGIRLAVGSHPWHLVLDVIRQGAFMTALGIVGGGVVGYGLASLAGSYFQEIKMPGTPIVLGSAAVLLAAAILASLVPALRAARVDVLEALHSE